MSISKKLALGCILAVLMAVPSTTQAFPACDNFGQDWGITLGPFGGVFPGTLLVTGCRDCNASLSCAPGVGPFALDGAAVITSGSNLVWSMTAYDTPADGCVSTHWTGSHPGTSLVVNGQVSNEGGPFGTFTLSLGTACRAGAEAADADPSSAQ
jgi:hypothetical protein